MSNTPKKFVWDDCLDTPLKSKSVKIKTIINAKYKENLPVVKQKIAQNNQRYLEERKKVAALVIKDSTIENVYSDVFSNINYNELPSNVKKPVLQAALRGSMTRITTPDKFSKDINLTNIEHVTTKKMHNIIFNLPKCIAKLAESYATVSLYDDTMLSYILVVLSFLKTFIEVITIELNEVDAVIVSCIYSFQKPVTIEEIYKRLENSNLLEKYAILSKSDICSRIKYLEQLKIVKLENDKCILIENVYI
jgi:hypothetical protein